MSKQIRQHATILNHCPTLMEVLQPRFYETNRKRAAVTITVRQPEMDEFERREAASKACQDSRPANAGVAGSGQGNRQRASLAHIREAGGRS
jgi:hypothetical protein